MMPKLAKIKPKEKEIAHDAPHYDHIEVQEVQLKEYLKTSSVCDMTLVKGHRTTTAIFATPFGITIHLKKFPPVCVPYQNVSHFIPLEEKVDFEEASKVEDKKAA